MATENEHGKLIAAAAKAALKPLGFVREGRSRVWSSDERFWTISIEFQPSGWSKGSYLNIGPLMLWASSMGTHHPFRAADFIPFESAAQFTPLIEEMAQFAAREVLVWRRRYRSLPDVARYLTSRPLRDGAPVKDAAIAYALAGDIEAARALFQRLAAWPTSDYDWQQQLREDGEKIAALLDDRDQFRRAILDHIQRERRLRGLDEDWHCLDEATNHPAP